MSHSKNGQGGNQSNPDCDPCIGLFEVVAAVALASRIYVRSHVQRGQVLKLTGPKPAGDQAAAKVVVSKNEIMTHTKLWYYPRCKFNLL